MPHPDTVPIHPARALLERCQQARTRPAQAHWLCHACNAADDMEGCEILKTHPPQARVTSDLLGPCHAQAGLALAFTSEDGSQPGSIFVAATISGRVIGR